MNRTAVEKMSRGGSLAFVLAAGLIAQSWAQAAVKLQGDPETLRREAVTHYQEGRYEQAIRLFRDLAASQPQNTAASRDLMWALWRAERYEEARQVALDIQQRSPQDKDAARVLERASSMKGQQKFNELREKAIASYQESRFDDAAKIYRELLALQPGNPNILKDLMWSLWQGGRLEEARQVAAQMAEQNPRDPESWNLQADALIALDRKEEAADRYKKSLELNPDQPRILMALGRLYQGTDDKAQAVKYFEQVKAKNPNLRQIYPSLGYMQSALGRYGDAAENWKKAVMYFPDRQEYALQEAYALFYSGKASSALSKMEKLAGDNSRQAMDFLTDNAMAGQKWDKAISLMEKYKGPLNPENEPRWIRLMSLYYDQKQYKECELLADQILKASPSNGQALTIKAQTLVDRGRWRDAIKVYERILELNPWHTATWLNLANACVRTGDRDRAISIIRGMRRLDPTSHSLMLQESQYIYEGGDPATSKAILTGWLENMPEPVLSVLLYHGLTPHRNDPMLAYRVHLSVSVFEDQIRALKKAGYNSITAKQANDWVHGKGKLPKNPLLITFDDGRMDSLQYADPILKKYNFKATMYVSGSNVNSNRPGYASWNVLKQYQANGRWEFQPHGDLGHTRIDVDDKGRKGLFLLNRMWNEKLGRMETVQEWKERVIKDHKSMKDMIEKNLGERSPTFAFPEGNYGQQTVGNFKDAAPLNLQFARQEYGLSFHQDFYGANTRATDPAMFSRLESVQDWTGETLVHYLRSVNPFIRIYRNLMKQALWQGNPHEAVGWLKALKAKGYSDQIASAEEGRIRFFTGDINGGYEQSRQAFEANHDPETETMIENMKSRSGPAWAPVATWQDDNRGRENWSVDQTLELPLPGSNRWRFEHLYASFRETEQEPILDRAVGGRWDRALGFYHSISAGILRHWFSNGTKNTTTGFGRLLSNWTDQFSTDLETGRSLYPTAAAIRNGVTQRYLDLGVRLIPDGPWRVGAQGRGTDISDGNSRRTGFFQISRSLDPRDESRALARFTFDSMKELSPLYYSPQHLKQYQLGAEYTPKAKNLALEIRYLIGLGKEDNVPSTFAQEFEAQAIWDIGDRTSLGPLVSLSKSPNYRRSSYSFILQHRFGR